MYRVIWAFALLPSLIAGQVTSAAAEWAAVERIAAGERIEVQLSAGKTLKGAIDHVTADAVYVRSGGKTIEARRTEVERLSRRKPGHGGRWAIIGGVAGAGAMGAFGGATLENKGGADFAGAVAGVVALGALLGAGVGYGLGHGRLELVYKAPTKKR